MRSRARRRLDDPLEGYRRSTEPTRTSFGPAVEEPEAALEPPAPSESLEDLIAEEEPFPEDEARSRRGRPSELPYDPERASAARRRAGRSRGGAGGGAGAYAADRSRRARSPSPRRLRPPRRSGAAGQGARPGRRAHAGASCRPGDTGGLPPLPPDEPELERAEPLSRVERRLPSEPFAEEPPADSGAPALYDFETDEDPLASAPAPADDDDDFEALGPAEEEAPYLEEEEPYAEEPVSGTEPPPEEPGTEVGPALEDEEVYEGGAPDPEETYEEEEEGEEGLWFEKGPPKDFDFDD